MMKELKEVVAQLGQLGLGLVILDCLSRKEVLKFLNGYGICYKGHRVEKIRSQDLAVDLAAVFFEAPEKEMTKVLNRASGAEFAQISEMSVLELKRYCRNVAGLIARERLGKVLWALANDERKEIKRLLPRLVDRAIRVYESRAITEQLPDLFTQPKKEEAISPKELKQEQQKVQALKRERDELRQRLIQLEARKGEAKQELERQAEENLKLRARLTELKERLTASEDLERSIRKLEKENRRLTYELNQLAQKPAPAPMIDNLTADLRRFIQEWREFHLSFSKGSEETTKLLRELEREVKGMRPIVTSLLTQRESKRMPGKRLGVFVDTQNLYYSSREIYSGKVDYQKLLDYIVRDRELVRAIAYVIENPEIDQTGFLSALSRCNFEIKRQPLIRRSDGSAKGNWDMGIAIDILELAERLGIVALVSGDGDFSPLLSLVKSKEVRVEVYGFTQTTAFRLKDVADQFFPLSEEILLR
jgi:uncharacterized LabA/DUF88 family protein/uncharacterized protein YigA (DUF484 family)